jgi:hypothetical protein
MANQYFNIHNGIKIGGLSIDAANGNITTTGTIVSTGTIPASFAGNVYVLGNIFFSTNGTQIFANDTDGATDPAYTWIADTNTGMFNPSTGVVGFSTQGVESMRVANGGNVWISKNTTSTTTTSGALVVAGGVGVAGAVNTGTLTSGTGQFNGTLTAVSVSAGTIGNIGAAVVGSSVNSGTGQFNGTLTAVSVSAGTIGNASATLTGSLSTAAQTNITSVGTLTGLTMSGAIVPNGNNTVALGSASAYWSTVYGVSFVGTSTTAKYADLAECYTSDAEYEPGTVLDFGGDSEVTLSTTDASTTVAGVVSTNPAYLMNSGLENVTQVQLALTGRVPCKVTGTVRQGQMMVSNGNGTARAETHPVLGSVIGKALQNFDGDTGVIEVVVGRL